MNPFDRELLRLHIADALERLHGKLFVPEMRLTLVARLPGNPEAELIVSDDELVEVMRTVERSMGRGC